MGEYTIELNYHKAKKQANDLEEAADSLEALSSKEMEGFMLELASGWKGEAANTYLKKAGLVQASIKTTASDLRKVSRNVRSAAERIYEAEMRALERARERSYERQLNTPNV